MSDPRPASEDRREHPRAVLEMPATAVRREVSLSRPDRVVSLRICDISRGGVGALVQEPLESDEPVVVFFPPMGPNRGLDAHGVVVRCEQRTDAYRLGISFETPWPEGEFVAVQPS